MQGYKIFRELNSKVKGHQDLEHQRHQMMTVRSTVLGSTMLGLQSGELPWKSLRLSYKY